MITRLVFCILALTLGAYAHANKHEKEIETFDVRAVTCEELTTMSEEQQGYVVVLIFGYQIGVSKKPVQTAASIDNQIKTAYQTCGAQPEMTILEAMTAAREGD